MHEVLHPQFVDGLMCVCCEQHYRVLREELSTIGPHGEGYRATVWTSRDQQAWTRLPMVLSFWTTLVHGMWIAWPPEAIDRLLSDGGRLQIEFRDPWVPYERPHIFAESLWRATFNPRAKRWSAHRVRQLAYDGPDKPSVDAPL